MKGEDGFGPGHANATLENLTNHKQPLPAPGTNRTIQSLIRNWESLLPSWSCPKLHSSELSPSIRPVYRPMFKYGILRLLVSQGTRQQIRDDEPTAQLRYVEQLSLCSLLQVSITAYFMLKKQANKRINNSFSKPCATLKYVTCPP